MESEEQTDQRSESEQKFESDQQTNQNEEIAGRVLTSSTCHNLACYNEQGDDDRNKENKLFKNKSESDLVVNKNKLNKIYLPAEDTMDLEESFKESTGKKYSSSWFYGDSSKNPYPTIEEQVKLCRKIASQLVDDENRKSKGAYMFYKRLKKSTKWVHEGQGTKENQSSNSTNSSLAADEEVEKMKRNLKLEAMPKLKLILDPRELLSLEKLKKTGDIVEHNIVSPDVCHNLVKDLNSPEINRGAAIFLKRKEKSRDWIVDENSTVEQIREKKREQEIRKQEENVQKEWLMKKQKEQELSAVADAGSLPKFDLHNLNAGQQKTLYIQAKQPHKLPTTKSESKFEDNCLNVSLNGQSVKHNIQTNQFLKLNYKNFNRNARGWGVTTNEYENQLKKLQETPEYRLNITFPINRTMGHTTTTNQTTNQMMSQPMNQTQNQLINQSTNHSTSNQNQNNLNPNSNLPTQYSSTQAAYKPQQAKQYPQFSASSQPKITNQNPSYYQPQSNLVNGNIKILNTRPISDQKTNGQHSYYQNDYSKTQQPPPVCNNNAHQQYYLNHLDEYNTYIFDKQPNKRLANFATYARNENHPFGQSPIYPTCYKQQQSPVRNDIVTHHLYNGTSNGQPNGIPYNSRPHFDLTKLQIPTPSIHSYKDFNAKPKLFVKC